MDDHQAQTLMLALRVFLKRMGRRRLSERLMVRPETITTWRVRPPGLRVSASLREFARYADDDVLVAALDQRIEALAARRERWRYNRCATLFAANGGFWPLRRGERLKHAKGWQQSYSKAPPVPPPDMGDEEINTARRLLERGGWSLVRDHSGAWKPVRTI